MNFATAASLVLGCCLLATSCSASRELLQVSASDCPGRANQLLSACAKEVAGVRTNIAQLSTPEQIAAYAQANPVSATCCPVMVNFGAGSCTCDQTSLRIGSAIGFSTAQVEAVSQYADVSCNIDKSTNKCCPTQRSKPTCS
eukprot:jgi/Botrbrau1/2829/Bobra.0125s0037.1